MGIRALCAAAVVAVGVGQAEAATIESGFYKVQMTLTENLWWCFSRNCEGPKPDDTPYHGLNLGDEAEGYFGFHLKDGYEISFTLKWPGHEITSETLAYGGFYRTSENTYYSLTNEHSVSFDIVDGVFSGWLSDDPYMTGFNSDGWHRSAGISFREIIMAPAPVPLPATAALLPLGIGALAMVRRRRKA